MLTLRERLKIALNLVHQGEHNIQLCAATPCCRARALPDLSPQIAYVSPSLTDPHGRSHRGKAGRPRTGLSANLAPRHCGKAPPNRSNSPPPPRVRLSAALASSGESGSDSFPSTLVLLTCCSGSPSGFKQRTVCLNPERVQFVSVFHQFTFSS